MQVLLLAMKDHAKHGDFLQNAGLAMVNMSNNEDNREVIRLQGGVDTVLGIMESGAAGGDSDSIRFMNCATDILTRLSVDDELSSEIATKGMHVLAKVARANFEHTELLEVMFQLVAQLAFIAENLLAIVQHGGVELIFDAIEKHIGEERLMVRSIEVLDHISMAEDAEYAAIVAEAKVRAHGCCCCCCCCCCCWPSLCAPPPPPTPHANVLPPCHLALRPPPHIAGQGVHRGNHAHV